MDRQRITVETIVKKPICQVWEKLTLPEHVMKWNNASEDWHTPSAENDLRAGGDFTYKMATKDGREIGFCRSVGTDEKLYNERTNHKQHYYPR